MSSSNLVRVAFIEETVYGQTPAAGNFNTARFTSDSLSGTPETAESQQIRVDRLSSGQVVTGLTVGGDLNFELAKEAAVDLFFASAMYSDWASTVAVSVDLTIVAAAQTLTRPAGDYTNEVSVGDILKLTGFSNSLNNVEVMVLEKVSTTVVRYGGPDTMVDEAGVGTSFQVSDKISIGTTKKSFSMEKAFLDLTNKAINYKGEIVSGFSLSLAYGSIATGAFSFSGNGYEAVDAAADFITDGRTIDSAATTNSMNGSIDMPFLVTASGAIFEEATFCIQSIDISLNNNLTPQTCIGEIAPKDYSPGTAQIEISINAYLSNEDWNLLKKKLTQDPFALGFMVKNGGGYYGFYLPAIQITGDDPASAGQNQDVILNLTGVAKVGANGESSLTMYRS